MRKIPDTRIANDLKWKEISDEMDVVSIINSHAICLKITNKEIPPCFHQIPIIPN